MDTCQFDVSNEVYELLYGYNYNDIIERLENKFIEFDINFAQFNQILQKHNAFISGSFLLQVIQNEFYPAKSYDIDIFTLGEKNMELEKEINNIIKKSILTKIIKKKISIIELNYFEEKELLNEMEIRNKKKKEQTELEEKKLKDKIDHYINPIITTEDTNLDNINYDYSIDINVNLLKNWKNLHALYGLPEKDTINICIDDYNQTVINKYKSVNECNKKVVQVERDYNFDKINEIVDFTITNDIMSKYQLIYYNNEKHKTPEDIINCFDLAFCANYWDGKKLFIKDYDSIKSKSAILNLTESRIYNNKNKRIVKYIKRNFDIKITYNEKTYNILYVENDTNINKEKYKNTTNLIILLNNERITIKHIIDNLPDELERLIIYTYNHKTIIDNLPITLQELKLYLWKIGDGYESGSYVNTSPVYNENYLKKINDNFKKKINDAVKNIKKIPFDCIVYINDEVVEI